MSDSFARETATTVTPNTEAVSPATSPVDDEKHNSTSRRPSHPSSPLPEAAPVSGGAGVVGEQTEKTEASATALNDHSSQPPARNENNEKSEHVTEENGPGEDGSARTGDPMVRKEGEAGAVEGAERSGEAEAEEEPDYPSGLKLGLLTFGLCMATFTVALDNTIIASKFISFRS